MSNYRDSSHLERVPPVPEIVHYWLGIREQEIVSNSNINEAEFLNVPIVLTILEINASSGDSRLALSAKRSDSNNAADKDDNVDTLSAAVEKREQREQWEQARPRDRDGRYLDTSDWVEEFQIFQRHIQRAANDGTLQGLRLHDGRDATQFVRDAFARVAAMKLDGEAAVPQQHRAEFDAIDDMLVDLSSLLWAGHF